MKKLFIFFVVIPLYANNFTPQPLVTLEGVNSNFDITGYWDTDVYICFENYKDSVYSIFLRQIEPLSLDYVLIAQDSIPLLNPSIDFISNDRLRIVWQSLGNDNWQIFSSIYNADSLTQMVQLTENNRSNSSPQVSYDQLYWLSDSTLYIGELTDSLTNIVPIDTNSCSRFDIGDITWSNRIIYEKNTQHGPTILEAWYNSMEKIWVNKILVEPSPIRLLSKSFDGEFFTYQKYDSVWICSIYLSEFEFWESNNSNYNVENAYYFTYPVPTSPQGEIRDFFVVYESDSLENNKDIILEFVPYFDKGKINISNSEGDDLKPIAVQIKDSIAVFWEHHLDETRQIYWAKEKFRPYTAIEESTKNQIKNFELNQNYPNPFNPVTMIEYYIPFENLVQLEVYNVRGQKIATLVNSIQKAGKYKLSWNASRYSSGMYFLFLKVGEHHAWEKMLFVK